MTTTLTTLVDCPSKVPPIRVLNPSLLGTFAAWCQEDHGDRALDTETTGLDTKAPDFRVTHLAFGASDGTAWIVTDCSTREYLRAVLAVAAKTGGRWWAHNATYDALALHAASGQRLRGLLCTLVLTKTLSPEIIGMGGGGSLKDLRPATYQAQERLRARWSAAGGDTGRRGWLAEACRALPADDSILLDYVASDAIECARLVGAWRGASTPTHRNIALRECRVEDLWRWTAARGYRIDVTQLRGEIDALADSRASCVRNYGIDLSRDTDDTRRWLAVRGIVVANRDGKPTLSRNFYASAAVPDVAQADWGAFLAVRELARTANKLTELRSLGASGRIYPSIRGIGARTGRMSIRRPALQNLPERLRGLLMSDEGHVLIGCDLDRVEPRVVATLSGDPELIAAVQHDVYTELAVAVWGEEARCDSGRRGIAKTAFLAMLYGQGVTSLSANLDISESEARDVVTGLRTAYPQMAAWMAGVQRTARDRLPLSTAFGRPLPPTPDRPYRAVNWVVQGTAADLFKSITIDLAERLSRDALWLPVHDELIVQVPVGEEERAVAALAAAMTTDLNGVPITGTPVVLGERWLKA